MNNLLFIHNKPNVFNIGDFLCTPQHYFDFGMNSFNSALFLKNKQYNIILGGGAYINYGVNTAENYKNHKIIAWGIGGSEELNSDSKTRFNDILENYSAFGTRDINITSESIKFLPCVSVLNNIVDLNIGNQLGVFLNFDTAITSIEVLNDIKEYCNNNNILFGTNSLYQREFEKIFSKTDKIITNSYHVAYWSLLSGRKVKIIGSSSKFVNLLNMFGLNEKNIFIYDRNNINSLKEKFYEATKSDNFYTLDNYLEFKDRFRQINIDFANKLVDKGLVASAQLVPQSHSNVIKREIIYNFFIRLRSINNQVKIFLGK